ncbi:hypothetical protein OG21DRAFT_713465 [Imleria badia]|nr:hypothetical protein OG21DRAFT_713465 [Imleria badia]
MVAKPARLAVPNHMMHDKTFRQQLPSPFSTNNRPRVVSTLPNNVQSFPLILIPVTLCIHHPLHRSLSLKITRNIPHVTRSTDSPHSLSIAFVLYYSSLYHPVHIYSLLTVWLVTCGFLHRFVLSP